MSNNPVRLVIYWAEIGEGAEHRVWHCDAHAADGSKSTAPMPRCVERAEQAVLWAAERWPGVPFEIGEPDCI